MQNKLDPLLEGKVFTPGWPPPKPNWIQMTFLSNIESMHTVMFKKVSEFLDKNKGFGTADVEIIKSVMTHRINIWQTSIRIRGII